MKTTSALLVLAASSLVGGCQTLFGSAPFAERAPSEASGSIDMSDYFAARLEAGRIHLERGRLTQAVTAFRQASYDPAYAARAYNGMGVAYAQIGRQDLARRYFAMAVSADPQDERFARNLARLDHAPVGGMERAELAAAAVRPSPGMFRENGLSEGQPGENSGLVRVSPREVQIPSAVGLRRERKVFIGPQQSPRPPSSVGVVAAKPAQSYPVRIELPQAASRKRQEYPVRIALSDVTGGQGASYPVRIELPDAN